MKALIFDGMLFINREIALMESISNKKKDSLNIRIAELKTKKELI